MRRSDVLADHATCNALQEIVENGEWDSYIDADLSGAQVRLFVTD